MSQDHPKGSPPPGGGDAWKAGPSGGLPSKVLIVDDDPTITKYFEEQLKKFNVNILKANNLETAMYLFNQNRFEVAIVELEFGELPGLALIQKWRNHDVLEKRATGFVVMAGQQRTQGEINLIREMGDVELVSKPVNMPQLIPILTRLLLRRREQMAFGEFKQKIIEPFVRAGELKKAIAATERKLAEFGQPGQELLFELLTKAGESERCLTLVDAMLQKQPNNAALLNSKGSMLMKAGKYKEAAVILEQVDKIAPGHIERINEMATLYLHLNKPDASVAKMKELVALNPEKEDVKFQMFSKLYDFGFDEHAQALGKETAKPTEIVRHYNNKGVIMSKNADREGALKEYARALKFYPKFKENYRIYYNIALALIARKSIEGYKEAAENLQKCLELSPDFDKGKKTLEAVHRAIETLNLGGKAS